MEQKLKDQLNKSPLKKSFIASQLDIHQSVLSMCLRGDRHLSPEKEAKLKELLKMVS